jgi:hypothetical protein
MVDTLAKRYSQLPDAILDSCTPLDYYLVKVLDAQNYVSELYIQLNYYVN